MLSLPVDTVALSKCRMLMADLDDDTSIINRSQSLRNTFTCTHNNHSPSNPFCLHQREQQPRIFLLHPTCEENNKRGTYWKIKRAEDSFVAFYLGESLEGSQDRVKKLSQLSVNVKRHHPRPNQENLHPLSCCSQIAYCKCSHSCMQSKDHTIWVGI